MFNQRKLTKYIWYSDQKWKVEQVFSPTLHDDYILVSRLNDSTIHIDDKTTPVDMLLINVHDDPFYCVTPRTTQLYAQLKNIRGGTRSKVNAIHEELDEIWCDMV